MNIIRRFPITSSIGSNFLEFTHVHSFSTCSLSTCYVPCAPLGAGGKTVENGGPAVLHRATLHGHRVCHAVDLLLDFSTSASVRGHHSSLFPASSASTGARVKLWAAWTTLTQRTHFLGMGTPTHEPSLGKIRAHFRVSFALSFFRVLKTLCNMDSDQQGSGSLLCSPYGKTASDAPALCVRPARGFRSAGLGCAWGNRAAAGWGRAVPTAGRPRTPGPASGSAVPPQPGLKHAFSSKVGW